MDEFDLLVVRVVVGALGVGVGPETDGVGALGVGVGPVTDGVGPVGVVVGPVTDGVVLTTVVGSVVVTIKRNNLIILFHTCFGSLCTEHCQHLL